jgi:hypothetical protein
LPWRASSARLVRSGCSPTTPGYCSGTWPRCFPPAVPALFGTRAVVSAELGRSNPDPEAFRRLAARLACAPDEILFFDDASYVAGAREAGLVAHRAGGAAGVRAGLAVHDLQHW